MNKVSESIWSSKSVVVPMADVQHIEKHYQSCDLADGTKKGELSGIQVITKHTKWDMEADTWANPIYISNHDKSAESFMQNWCYYRHELEGGKEAFKKPNE